MDYISFSKAMQRADKALSDGDSERHMKTLLGIIKKFDPQRTIGEGSTDDFTISRRLACLDGSISYDSATAIYIGHARSCVSRGIARPIVQTLQEFLVICSYYPGTHTLRKSTSYHYSPPDGYERGSPQTRLPTEIWCEIASWLARADLKNLLPVSHHFRHIVSERLFGHISLYFMQENWLGCFADSARNAWYLHRSIEIMTRISRDASFADRLRALKICAFKGHRFPTLNQSDIGFQIAFLTKTLKTVSCLKTLTCFGSHIYLMHILHALPVRLEGLTVRLEDGSYNHQLQWKLFDIPLTCQELAIYPMPHTASNTLFKGRGPPLRKLRISEVNYLHYRRPIVVIAPILENLTHLELTSHWDGVDGDSVFQIILTGGHHLESLRIRNRGDVMQQHSSHFRHHAKSLPRIREFGVHLGHLSSSVDPDFFPAICDFLKDRPLLQSLELVIQFTERSNFGYGQSTWNFISSLQGLRILSATVHGPLTEPISQLVPRSLETLMLSDCAMTLYGAHLPNGWPEGLRFIGIGKSLIIDASLAQIIATNIPSVRVIKLGYAYFSVVDQGEGKTPRVEQWPSWMRVFRDEHLESYGCGSLPFEYLHGGY